MHHCIAALSRSGNHVLVDHILAERWILDECVTVLAGLPVLFVGVRCPLEVADRRERERVDHFVGKARVQAPHIHAHGLYDLEVDSSQATAVECALQIKGHLESGGRRSAFEELRALRQTGRAR